MLRRYPEAGPRCQRHRVNGPYAIFTSHVHGSESSVFTASDLLYVYAVLVLYPRGNTRKRKLCCAWGRKTGALYTSTTRTRHLERGRDTRKVSAAGISRRFRRAFSTSDILLCGSKLTPSIFHVRRWTASPTTSFSRFFISID